ncbi:MAG: alpha/beta fold hydrolase [Myxococcales bacterium]|nr:alpha/beta fold hydrolase [Myxococcales bacterium]
METRPAPPLPSWLSAMLPFRRYTVDVGGLDMHVMECGQGTPVLMVHGNPTWGFLYRKVATALDGRPVRLIIPDLIGLGLSSKPRSSTAHTIENHGSWLASLVRQLGFRELILVCQDWGGPFGFEAVRQLGLDRLGAVVMNTVLSPPKPDLRPTAFHAFARLPLVSDVAFRLLGFPQNAMFVAQGDKLSIRGKVRRGYMYPLRSPAGGKATLALARLVPDSMSHPAIEPLGRIQRFVEDFDGPAAIVWGDKDPVLGSVRNWIAKLLPQAEVTRTNAGHFLQEEVPDVIAAAILKVRDRL